MGKSLFKQGEVVWAKLDDYPYWPSRIASKEIHKQMCQLKECDGVTVLFFGKELTYGLVNKEHVKNFKEYMDEFKNVKLSKSEQADFDEAMNLALNNNDFIEPPFEILESDRPSKKQKKNNYKTKENKAEEKGSKKKSKKEKAEVEISSASVEMQEKLAEEKILSEVIGPENKIQDNISVPECENADKKEAEKVEEILKAENDS